MTKRRSLPSAATLALAGAVVCASPAARAGGTLVVGMTAGDLPITTGNPDQGFEGYRFVGYNLYDSLVLWNLSSADKASDIKPGLASEWNIDETNNERWIFKLREGVKWHDGCDFAADDVVWNLRHSIDPKALEFDPGQYAQTTTYLGNVAGFTKIDDHTVAIDTKVPLAISTSGSGQMQPLPMNELVKSEMDADGFQVTLQTMDWNALLDITRAGVDKYPDISAINVSRQTQDPFNALIRHVWTNQWAPHGANWGHYSEPENRQAHRRHLRRVRSGQAPHAPHPAEREDE